jgi:phosphatidate phosphatase APP1
LRATFAFLILVSDLPHDETRTAHFQSYGAWGTTEGASFLGRVVEGEAPSGRHRSNPWGKRGSTAGAFLRGDVDDAAIVVSDTATGMTMQWRTDDEGFYDVRLPGPLAPGRHTFRLELTGSAFQPPAIEISLDVADASSEGLLAVVDIDDTLTETGVTAGAWDLVWTTVGRDAGDMRPFPGSKETLSALAAEGVPIFYVSASPVELAPRLSQFLREQGFPEGPLVLRYWPTHGIRDPRPFKRRALDRLLADFPMKKLVLFGDNGEHDPELFAEVAKNTGRVAAAYVRTTLKVEKDDPRYSGMVAFRDWREVACDAGRRGLIRGTAAEAIAAAGTP